MQRQFSKRDRRETRGRWPAPAFEFLEQRLLLSADSMTSALARPLSVDLHDGLNDVTLRLAEIDGGSVVQIVDQTGSIQAERLLDQVTEITVNGTDFVDDILRIDLDSPLPVPVSFDGGEGGSDTLRALADSTWNITGTDSGEVEGVQFSGVENLTGARTIEDTFIVEAVGGISGLIDGGQGGYDSLELASGQFDTVTFTVVDSQTVTIDRDGNVLTFRGLEPAVDNTGGAKVVNDPTAGASTITISGAGGGITVAAPEWPESFVFTAPGNVTVNAGAGNDQITIQSLDTYANTLLVNGGVDSEYDRGHPQREHDAYRRSTDRRYGRLYAQRYRARQSHRDRRRGAHAGRIRLYGRFRDSDGKHW